MPRNNKEGILFSFTMSAIMIYVMAALNYGVRTGDLGSAAWTHALVSFPLGYLVGMVCDLFVCTPLSRRLAGMFCDEDDRGVWWGITIKFVMVVLMTVAMTIFGAIMAFGVGSQTVGAFFSLFPYNFTIALPIQMLAVAPLSGKFVHAVGDRLGWDDGQGMRGPATAEA